MRDILTSIRRTPYQSLSSFSILFFTLLLFLFFFNLTSFFHSFIDYVVSRPQVIVYFQTETEESEILKVKSQMEKSGKVSSVDYVSQKDALKIYKDMNKDNPILLEMVSEQILPASLEIYAKQPEFLAEIARDVSNIQNVDEVNYQQVIVERLITISNILRQMSLGLFAMLTFVTVTVLLTTTAFKISVKRDEIEVLRLIGASKWYIRKPFLMEGVFFGILSGTAAFALFYSTFFSLSTSIAGFLAGIPLLPFWNLQSLGLFVYPPSIEYVIFTYVIVILFGIIISFIGNYLATSKYIKY